MTTQFTARDALAAAIRRSIVTGQETPGQMAERILADPKWRADLQSKLQAAVPRSMWTGGTWADVVEAMFA